MKNRLPFAALTFAFTIAGACIGYLISRESDMTMVVFVVAGIGAFAAAMSGDGLS